MNRLVGSPPTIAISEELKLRALEPEDAQALFSLVERFREQLGQQLAWVHSCLALADAQWYVSNFESDDLFGKGSVWAIDYKNQFIGSVGLHSGTMQHRKSELGYWLAPSHWSRGIMKRALQTLLEHVFQERALNRISARIAPNNEASLALVRRLGFRKEGLERQGYCVDGEFKDVEVWSLLKCDWEQR